MDKPLRICRQCGLKVFDKDGLSLFVKSKRYKHGRVPICKNCVNKNSQFKRDKSKPHKNYLRKCRACGLEAKTTEDLRFFTKNKNCKHGRDNLCKTCVLSFSRKGGKYFKHVSDYKKKMQKNTAQRKIRFKEKRIYFDKPIRINICSTCGKSYPKELKTQTHIHHLEYNENHPLKHTIELCGSCHQKLHREKERKQKNVV